MSLTDVLDELRIAYLESGHHHCRSGWIQLKLCPFCHSDNYHLGYNVSSRYFVCWKCRGHSTRQTFHKLGIPPSAVKDLLKGLAPQTIEKSVVGKLQEPPGRGPLLDAHCRYLRQRGFKPSQLVRQWQIEGIGPYSALAWRIYIPVIIYGKRVSWTTRAIGQQVTQRYISAPNEKSDINLKQVVYGLDYCRHSVVIVEGPLDAWAVGPGAGALFGTAVTPAQMLLLSRIPYRFVCFDSDPSAQTIARQIAADLSIFPGETCNVVLDAKDPGEASIVELRRLRRLARLD